MRKIIITVIIVIIAAASFVPFCRDVFNFTVVSSASALAQKTSGAISAIRSYFKLSQLDKQVKDLKEENASLASQLIQYRDIARENTTLRSEINLSARWSEKYNLQSARVLGKTPKTYWQKIVVDKGSRDGIQKNNVVIYKGYLMGVVSEVYEDYCYIDIVSANQIYIPVILEKSRGTGILKGGLAGLYMEEIPLEYKVEVGDVVVTQNFENQVVAGIPVGRVKKVISRKGDIFQSAQIELPVDFVPAEIVTIISAK